MRKIMFAPEEYYHVFSRTILNIPVFKNVKNLKRLKLSFLLANSENSKTAFQFLRNNKRASIQELLNIARGGKKLVDVLCYTIMPDHYHLLLREREENGVSEFIRKCNISISKYRNTREEKKGTIFEGRFKAKYIDNNRYLLHLSSYIHLNPLDFLVGREWRRHGLEDWSGAKKKLLQYEWSSVRCFLVEKEEDPIVSGQEVLLGQFKNKKEYESFLTDWAGDSLDKIKDYIK